MMKCGPEWDEAKVSQFLEGNADDNIELLAFQLASVAPNTPAPPPPEGAAVAEGEQRENPTETAGTGLGNG
jgi:hypothetical protein